MHPDCKSTVKSYALFWTDDWYSVVPQHHEESNGGDSNAYRTLRSSSGHTRVSRAVLGGGLSITTLPDNMTRVVVSYTPQCSLLL